MPVPVPVPVVHLAHALGGIAVQAIVTQVVRGSAFDRNEWATVAGQIVKAMIDTSRAQESTLQQLGKKIDEIPRREYNEHMAAGRRYLREVTPQWRTERDRRDMIRDARSEFVRASAIAEEGNDLLRQVTAEVAIAGCWLWVPSLDDVKNTIANVLTLLEEEILIGVRAERTTPAYTAAYADIVTLARGYGVGRDKTRLVGHTAPVHSVAFSPDGKILASGSSDRTVRLWDMATGHTMTTLTEDLWGVHSVAFSPDGKTLATGDQFGTVQLWDVATHRYIRPGLHGNNRNMSIAFSPDGKTLATGGGTAYAGEEVVRFWDVATHQQTGGWLTGHTGGMSVAFSPDGKTLATAGGPGDGTVRFWDVAARRQIAQSLTARPDGAHPEGTFSVAFNPDGTLLASGGGGYGKVRLWSLAFNRVTILDHLAGKIYSVAFSADGRTLASGGVPGDGMVRLWNVTLGRVTTTLGPTAKVESLAFSPDGNTLAGGISDGTVRLWVLR
jgi:DNA-binding beta-propeller fold protein YncE